MDSDITGGEYEFSLIFGAGGAFIREFTKGLPWKWVFLNFSQRLFHQAIRPTLMYLGQRRFSRWESNFSAE